LLYDRFMNVFSWGQMDNPDTWVDFYTQRTVMILRIRYNHTLLAEALLAEGKIERAVEVLDRIVQIMPKEQFPYEIFAAGIAESYYKCGATDKANDLINSYLNDVYQDLGYFIDLQTSDGSVLGDEAQRAASILSEIDRLTRKYGQNEIAESIQTRINELVGKGS